MIGSFFLVLVRRLLRLMFFGAVFVAILIIGVILGSVHGLWEEAGDIVKTWLALIRLDGRVSPLITKIIRIIVFSFLLAGWVILSFLISWGLHIILTWWS